jgi:hypothetical protein
VAGALAARTQHGRHLPIVALLPLALLLAGLAAWLVPAPARAQGANQPESCRVGAYLTGLHDFNPINDTFQADLWLWSVCADPARRPLDTMEFVNADDVNSRLPVRLERDGVIWASSKVRGTFRHDWNERNFPFDRQTLTIILEEGGDDVSQIVYQPDRGNSGFSGAIDVPGWRITDFSLNARDATYNTTFGDPALPEGGASTYSRLTIDVGIARTDISGFFKLTAVVYAAFVLSLLSYVLHLESATVLSAQMGLLAGALFAAAVNLLTASSAIEGPRGLTLVDKIHITVILYILAATVVAVLSRLLVERGWTKAQLARLNSRAFVIAAVSFVAINVALIAMAARAG